MARPATNHEACKAAIIEAALDCFTRYGYDGATNKLIAEAAGMKSAGIIYHYFPSKEDLFQACLEQVSAFDTMRDTVAANQDDPPDIFLRKVGQTYLAMMRADQRLVRLFLLVFSSVHSHPELPPLALRRVVPAFIQPLFAYLQGQVDLLTEETGNAQEAGLAARAVCGAFHGYLETLARRDPAQVGLPDLPDDPTALSYLVAASMILDLPVRQSLLAEPDALHRLAAERALLARETTMLRSLTATPAPEFRNTPYNPN